MLYCIQCTISCVLFLLFNKYRYRRREPSDGNNINKSESQSRSRKRTSSDHSLSSKHGLIGGKNGNVVPNSPSDIPMSPLADGG